LLTQDEQVVEWARLEALTGELLLFEPGGAAPPSAPPVQRPAERPPMPAPPRPPDAAAADQAPGWG
jgi:hypothetical protein